MNKKYGTLWKTQFYPCRFITCIAIACSFSKFPACEENQCIFLDSKDCQTNNDCIFTKESGCINNDVFNRFNYISSEDLSCKCKDKRCIETENEIKEDTGYLTISINQPLNNSRIASNNVYLTASTNRKAVCWYQDKVIYSMGYFNIENESEFKLMNLTNGTSHSQLLDLLDGGDYTIRINCTDNLGNSQASSVKFFNRGIMPGEFQVLSTSSFLLWIGSPINRARGSLSGSELSNLLSSGKIYRDNLNFHNIYYSDKRLLETLSEKYVGISDCETFNWCENADINMDGTVNSTDFDLLNNELERVDCKSENNWCNRADINHDGKVLSRGYEEGLESAYTTSLVPGSSKIENSTSNDDFTNPKALIEVGVNPSNYLYKYIFAFSKNVNFTDENFHGKILKILGENYTISSDSTNPKIILTKVDSNRNIILENNQPVKVDNSIVNGTYVSFMGYGGTIAKFEINFAMQDSNKDYIAVGEYYDEPVFQNIRVTFKSYSVDRGAEIYIGSVK